MDVRIQDAPDSSNMVIHSEGLASACDLNLTADSSKETLRNVQPFIFPSILPKYSPNQLMDSMIAHTSGTFSFGSAT